MQSRIYVLSGLCAAIVGILQVANISSATADLGQFYELNAIAAVVIGGASLAGGRGTVRGTIIGALVIGFLANGLVIVGVSPFWQQVVTGAVIILAVAVDQIQQIVQRRRNARRAAAEAAPPPGRRQKRSLGHRCRRVNRDLPHTFDRTDRHTRPNPFGPPERKTMAIRPKLRRRVTAPFLAGALALSLAACGGGGTAAAPAPASGEAPARGDAAGGTIAIITVDPSNPYWKAEIDTAEAEVKKAGYKHHIGAQERPRAAEHASSRPRSTTRWPG